MRQASHKLGLRLMKIFQPFNKSELIDGYALAIKNQEIIGHYCIVFALYAHSLNIKKEDALSGFYYNAAVGYVTNAVKLIPLSQQSGQEILFSIQDLIAELVQQTVDPDEDLIGMCCSGFDIRSMQHEQLY
jgi:urease accessory protein